MNMQNCETNEFEPSFAQDLVGLVDDGRCVTVYFADRSAVTPASGGPRSKTGKKIVALNPVRHGILSPNPVIPGMEEESDWQAHLEGINESLKPDGHFERELAERIALSLWQLKRLTRYVASVTFDAVAEVEREHITNIIDIHGFQAVLDASAGKPHDLPVLTEDQLAHRQEMRMLPDSERLEKIERYEAHLHRLVDKSLRALESLQAKRLGHDVRYVRHI